MKAIIHIGALVSLIVVSIAAVCVSGCATNLSPGRPGYEDGRVATVMYMATENIMPDQVRETCKMGYKVLGAVYGEQPLVSEELLDKLVDQKIEELAGPGATPEVKQLIKNFYSMARARVDGALVKLPGVGVSEYLGNFEDGIESALVDYGYKK